MRRMIAEGREGDLRAAIRRSQFIALQAHHQRAIEDSERTRSADEIVRIQARVIRRAWRDKVTFIKDREGRYLHYSAPPDALITVPSKEHIGRTDVELFGEIGE